MVRTSAKRSLGFFDLPPEIRLRILEFTQLNAAMTPAIGYLPIWKGRLGIPREWRRESAPLCFICARNTSSNSYCLVKRFGHAKAYAYLSACWCRFIPFSLFTVSKQMKVEAEYTFFKFNGFEFFPSRSLDVCGYLRDLTVYRIQLIRDLRFTFSYQQCEYWNETGRNDWRLLLNWIKYNENLRNLRVIIDVDCHFVYPDRLRWYHTYQDPTRYEDDPVYVNLYQMVCEIALEAVIIREKLQGLRLRLPYFHLLERLLEQEVMGIGYDSHQGGEPWKTLEARSPHEPRSHRLPPWHDIAWEVITRRYRKLMYLLEQSEPKY